MSRQRQASGLKQIPPVFDRPLWRDAFLWLLIVMICLWTVAIVYFFF